MNLSKTREGVFECSVACVEETSRQNTATRVMKLGLAMALALVSFCFDKQERLLLLLMV